MSKDVYLIIKINKKYLVFNSKDKIFEYLIRKTILYLVFHINNSI